MNNTLKNSLSCNLDIDFSRQGKYVPCHEKLDIHFWMPEEQLRNAGIVAVQETCNSLTCTANLVLLPLDIIVLACKSPIPAGYPKTKQSGKPMKKTATPKATAASRTLAPAQQQLLGGLATADVGKNNNIKIIKGISPNLEALRLKRQGHTCVEAPQRHDGT